MPIATRTRTLLALSLLLAGCAPLEELVPGAPLPVRSHEGVTYRAETRAIPPPGTYETTATLTNATTSRQVVQFPDGCVVLVRAYRNAARSGPPAWDQGRVVACTLALVEIDLVAGASAARTARFETAQVLGDSLPTGRYYLTAYLRPANTMVEVTAGEADLSR